MTSKIVGGERTELEAVGIRWGVDWAEFQRALDAYRDAAYWAGYKDAKDEILESQVKGEL